MNIFGVHTYLFLDILNFNKRLLQILRFVFSQFEFLSFMQNKVFWKSASWSLMKEPNTAGDWKHSRYLSSLKLHLYRCLPLHILHLSMYKCSTTFKHYIHQISRFNFKFYKIRPGQLCVQNSVPKCNCIVHPNICKYNCYVITFSLLNWWIML